MRGLGRYVGGLALLLVGLLGYALAIWLIVPTATGGLFAPGYVQCFGIAGLGCLVGNLLTLGKDTTA